MNDAELNAVFSSMMRGSGSCPAWTHTNEDMKFTQFGWRCTNSENLYKPATLVGNWTEERFDLKELRKRKPIPSATSHAFTSTYADSYLKGKATGVPSVLQHQLSREKFAFAGHQPELNPPSEKRLYNSFLTTYRDAFDLPAGGATPGAS